MPIKIGENGIFENDHLGFRHSVNRLSEIMDNVETPFSLGVYGTWGSGKTSFMRMLEAALKENGQTTFWFDAWQYENETSLMLPLLAKMSKEFKGANKQDAKKLFKKVTKIASAVALTGIGGLLKAGTAGNIELKDVKHALELVEVSQKKWVDSVDGLRTQFQELVNKIKYNSPSLVIFIDDLDRCLPENMVKLIENIKHFLSAEGCIFVMGVDKDVLSKGIQARYGSNLISGDEYLQKIINLSFDVPHSDDSQIEKCVNEMVGKMVDHTWGREIINETKKLAKNLGNIQIICNPRQLKFIIYRYLLFLSFHDSNKYFVDDVLRLIVFKEFYPDAYAEKKRNKLIHYFPSPDELGAAGPNKMKESSWADFTKIHPINSLWLIDFTRCIPSYFTYEHSTEVNISDLSNAREREAMLADGKRMSHKEYFELIDFLFSLS